MAGTAARLSPILLRMLNRIIEGLDYLYERAPYPIRVLMAVPLVLLWAAVQIIAQQGRKRDPSRHA